MFKMHPMTHDGQINNVLDTPNVGCITHDVRIGIVAHRLMKTGKNIYMITHEYYNNKTFCERLTHVVIT